ncbi:DUF418 domain-containing protein [Hyphococcus sp.]|uniref:DUF418 domain-containing protein n=1 Tax=Hyphococcus sp. TaxID=2038636 RepID=UPI003CCBD431
MLAAPRQERFESLDVLRGVAVLAIFAVNIQAMALPAAMFANPSLNTEFFDAKGEALWSFVATFIQFKFITIFSALFGAGIILMVGVEKPSDKIGLHYRRMAWLLLFGLIHAFLIWFGDILTPYAVAGMIVVLARRWRPRTLLIAGVLLVALSYLLQMSMYLAPEDARQDIIDAMWAPPAELLQQEITQYRAALWERLPHTAPNAILFQLVQTVLIGPRNIGVMMFGMALYKTGFFTGGWPMLRYIVFGAAATAAGVASSAYATGDYFRHNFEMFALFNGQTALYWGSLPHAFGYAALILAGCKIPFAKLLRAPFAAAGRMALTNYLACSIIGAGLFYGSPGLGLIGAASYPDMAKTVIAVWIAILIWSPLWLSLFRLGPFEWVWRSLTYWRAQPLKK